MSASLNQILHVTRSGMLSRLLDLGVASNNLANMNTVAFKSSRSNFQELLSDRLMSGTQIRSTQRFMEQGSLQVTESPFDIAIDGEGFFAVTLPNNTTAYTRDGQFTLDANLNLVTVQGQRVVWTGAIPPDASEFHVNPDGTVMALQGDVWNQVGQIPLFKFANTDGLEGFGQNLWLATEVSGAATQGAANSAGFGTLIGNAVEASNVNIALEMTHLMTTQRSFELSLRTFQQTEQMLTQAIHMRK